MTHGSLRHHFVADKYSVLSGQSMAAVESGVYEVWCNNCGPGGDRGAVCLEVLKQSHHGV